MNREKSCGAVVFMRNAEGSIRYVLVQQRSGRYCFPKGHVESGETEHQTAQREIWEETGLCPRILPVFRESESYEVIKSPGTMKDVVYFLAEYSGQDFNAIDSNEIHEVLLCTCEEALDLLPTESRKCVLIKANDFLTGKGPYIRSASIDDLDEVSAVEAECFPPAEAASRETLAERLKIYGNHFLLMFKGGRLISFIDGFVTDEPDLTDEMFADASLHNEEGAWQMIFGLNTVPSERKKGHAGQLIRMMTEDARAQGRKGLVLTCKAEKIDYYASFGFVNEGVTEKSVHGGAQWYQMRLTF